MKISLLLTIILTALITGCVTNDPNPAEIQFIYLPSVTDANFKKTALKYSALELPKVSETNIDLGELPGSRNYYFIIKNAGDLPATNLTLSVLTEHEGITFNNTELKEVPPFSTLELSDVLQNYIVRLTISHGILTDGSGSTAPLLPQGNLNLVLSALTDNSETTVAANIKVLLTDLTAYDENGEIDLVTPISWTFTGGFEAGDFVPNFPAGQNAKIVNTGNVNLPIEVFNNVTWKEDHLLKPGEELEVMGDRTVTIAIKEASAVRDLIKFPVISNNKCYFALDRRIY